MRKLLFAIPVLFAATLLAQTPAVYTIAAGSSADTFCPGKSTATYSGFPTESYFPSGSATCAIPLANGTYNVTLQEMEEYFKAAGQRVFSATANGTVIFSGLDIYKEVGANKSDDKTAQVTVSSGVLVLTLTSSVNLPKYNGIIITPVSVTPPPTTNFQTLSIGNLSTYLNQNINFQGCRSDDAACTMELAICDEKADCIHLAPGAHTISLYFVANQTLPAVQTSQTTVGTTALTVSPQ